MSNDKESVDAPTTDATPSDVPSQSSQAEAFNPETGEINWDCEQAHVLVNDETTMRGSVQGSVFMFCVFAGGAKGLIVLSSSVPCRNEHPEIYSPELTREDVDDDDERMRRKRR
ncbi:hypothetical protein BC829DRAFT_445860 [Chytridium lagenaria]|nr:hypothetical protein BC829DRAFT_445860 [Chytridium lagenaria]